ncbi:MAG: transposase [Pseudomonadota bacterium]|nr:transposase [Pseudomonadota bacterium]
MVKSKSGPSISVNNLKTLSRHYIRKKFNTELKKIYWNKSVFWIRSYRSLSRSGVLSILKP